MALLIPARVTTDAPAQAPGDPLGADLGISTSTGAQVATALAYGVDADRYLVVWQDSRYGLARTYGQELAGNGRYSTRR